MAPESGPKGESAQDAWIPNFSLQAVRQMSPRHRLLCIATHVIQYQTPLYRALSKCPDIALTVVFCSKAGIQRYWDAGFRRYVEWDRNLLEGFSYEFARNLSPLPNPSTFWGLFNPGIVRKVAAGHSEAVLIHGWARLTYWLAFVTARLCGIPLMLRVETNLLSHPKGWKGKIKRRLLTALFRQVDGFLAIGRHNAEFYRSYGVPPDKIFLTPYAVDNDFFFACCQRLAPRKGELKRKLGFGEDTLLVLFSGKLVPQKRPLDLLLAVRQLSESMPVAVLFVGAGRLGGKLQAYARAHQLESSVRLLGFRNQTELAEAYAAADVFVLPSDVEPWGLVVNEAMCFGLPVIVSDQVGSGGDLVRDGVNGFVYPAGRVDVLAKLLREVLSDGAVRQAMGKESRSIIEQWGYREDICGILKCLESIRA